ncbi:MAG: hypothetical protein OZ927_06655 [Alcaligenaceae bacterium]|nr:hypothetical protein [Alcaligenaceae bacterium]
MNNRSLRVPLSTPAGAAAGRRVLGACLLSLGCGWPIHAEARASFAAFSEFAAPGLLWTSSQSMLLSGVPLRVRAFSYQGEPLRLAQLYAAKPAYFQRILVAGGGVVLSGLRNGEHWLAELHPAATGTSGRLSVMRVARGQPPDPGRPRPVFRWLPPQARPLFSLQDRPDAPPGKAGAAGQHVFSVAMSVTDLTAYLRRRLRSDGWVEEPAYAAVAGHSAWRRSSSRLALSSLPEAEGESSLYVHHID